MTENSRFLLRLLVGAIILICLWALIIVAAIEAYRFVAYLVGGLAHALTVSG